MHRWQAGRRPLQNRPKSVFDGVLAHPIRKQTKVGFRKGRHHRIGNTCYTTPVTYPAHVSPWRSSEPMSADGIPPTSRPWDHGMQASSLPFAGCVRAADAAPVSGCLRLRLSSCRRPSLPDLRRIAAPVLPSVRTSHAGKRKARRTWAGFSRSVIRSVSRGPVVGLPVARGGLPEWRRRRRRCIRRCPTGRSAAGSTGDQARPMTEDRRGGI